MVLHKQLVMVMLLLDDTDDKTTYALILRSSLDSMSRDMYIVDVYSLGVTARIVALGRDCLVDGGSEVDFGKL